MLSNNSLKLLKWFAKQDRWLTQKEAQECKYYDERSLKFLAKEKYLETTLDIDESQWVKYRINEPGKAYIEGTKYARTRKIQDWLALLFSAVALAVSIISELN